MKKKLFASLIALCGLTSFAVDPVAVWNGDFTTTTKGDYTLSANGNTVATDGSSITISTAKGVTFERSSALANNIGMTVIYKFDNLVVGSTIKTIGTASAGGGNADRVGVNVQTSGQTSGIWANTTTYNDGANQTTISTVDKDGQFALVYGPAVANNTGTYLYLKNGSADYTLAYSCGGLKGGNDTVQAMTVGGTRNNGGTFPAASDMVIKAVALFDQALTQAQIAEYVFPKKSVPAVEPLMLLNVHKDSPVDGWYNHTQPDGPTIPKSGTITTNDISFAAGNNGNFFPGNWTRVSSNFTSGDYADVFGQSHTDLIDEIKASLGLPEGFAFTEDVYKTGLMNGGTSGHTATISGLSADAKYVIYAGFGLVKDVTQCQGFKIQSSGYTSVESREYVTTIAGEGTSVATSYQTFNENTTIRPGAQGLMVVRLKNVIPTAQGAVSFILDGERAGINFLAVAKVNETITYTTAEIDGGSEISVRAINEALTETNDKAEVTLTAGATVYVDETPAVPTKFICEGAITLSSTEKPDLSKFDLSGVTGGIVRTWLTDDEKTKGIGFNFAKGCGPNTTQALVETAWYDNAKENNGTNKAFSSDGLTTITYTSKNTYNDSGNNNDDANGTLVKGYLDDGNGDGVQITVKNVPFAEYAVIIYASTDQGGKTLSFKKVNGTNYTYDSAHSDVAKTGEDAWGACQSSSSVSYGRNAIRVIEQTAGTLTIESKRDDSKNVRGCISAIQIVPYSSFFPPEVIIASVESKCSEDYKSNTITCMIEGIFLNSWTGDMIARVVVDSKIYESAAIKEKTFTIEVSDLTPEKVYRTNLEVGYTKDNVFTAVATQPIALYQGERQYTWMASPIVIKEKGTINAGEGCTVPVPTDMPDYVENCDSEYTVSISASEAVNAGDDDKLIGDEQGGVRIANTDKGLKLQVLTTCADAVGSGWVDLADAELGTKYVVNVHFHYAKNANERTEITYTCGETSMQSDNQTDKTKVTEVFIADGTVLPADLTGLFQFDSAVIVDLELKPGEGDYADYNTKAEALAAVEKLKIGICDAVKNVLTTAEAQENYRKYFHLVVVPSKMLENGFSVMPEFTTEATNEIEKELEKVMEKVVEAFNAFDGKAEITGKPGLYYGVKRGDSLEAMSVKEDLQMAGADGKVTISITKPDTSKSHFYRIIVSPTPAAK